MASASISGRPRIAVAGAVKDTSSCGSSPNCTSGLSLRSTFHAPRPPKSLFTTFDAFTVNRLPDLLLAIRRCRKRREVAVDLYEQLDSEPTPFEMTASLRNDPERVAEQLRTRLNISFDEQRSWQDQYEAFRRWRTQLESEGVLAFQATDVEIDEACGFSIAERPLPAVVVNIKDSVYGRVFTLVHELAPDKSPPAYPAVSARHNRECSVSARQGAGHNRQEQLFCERFHENGVGAGLQARVEIRSVRRARNHDDGHAACARIPP